MSQGSLPPTHRVRSRTPWLRLLILLFVAGGLAGLGMWGLVWWEERPLSHIEGLLKQQKPEDALHAADQYLHQYPQHGKAASLKARALVELRRPGPALEIFQVIGADGFAETHAWAQALLQEEHWSQALLLLERCLTWEPDNPETLHEITACRTMLGLYDDAIASAKLLAKHSEYVVRAYVQLGTIYDHQRKFQAASEAWGHVLELDPDAKQVQVPLHEFTSRYGSTLISAGHPEAAIPVLNRSLEIRPTAEAWYQFGQALSETGNEVKALDAWNNALQLQPQHQKAREMLAQQALRAQMPQEALALLEPLETLDPLPSSVSYLLQRIQAALGNAEKARHWEQTTIALRKQETLRQQLDQLLVEQPQSFWARVVRCYRFAEVGNWEEAADLVGILEKQAPQEAFVHDLATAIQARGMLPDLHRLPLKQTP